MLKNIRELIGCRVHAKDGNIGKVSEFYFDADGWRIRYLLVDAYNLPTKGHMLIPLNAFMEPDWDNKMFCLNIDKGKANEDPKLDANNPVIIDYGRDLTAYCGWPVYPYTAGEISPPVVSDKAMQAALVEEGIADHQILGVNEIYGYSVFADDGEIGKIEDIIVDDVEWHMIYFVIGMGPWPTNERIRVSPDMVESIIPENSRMNINILKKNIKPNATYDVFYEEVPQRVGPDTTKEPVGAGVRHKLRTAKKP